MKRIRHVFETIISEENLSQAIEEVNRNHRWFGHHQPNACTAWVEETKQERIEELRDIILAGFCPQEPKHRRQYDANAKKWRDINEPRQWPDQYVHHALIQALMPVMMRGMDPWCCGSVKGRGERQVREGISHWMSHDYRGTKYCGECDIHHCYDTLRPDVIMDRFQSLVCDHRAMDLLRRCIGDRLLIGAYPSQWCCNTTLQPLDQMIRQSGLCSHYVRYMDNITVFGPNKRKLRRLLSLINCWLNAHGMELKGDWQVYRTEGRRARPKRLDAPRRGVERPKRRLPSAVGYRYGRGYVLPRKHILLNIKRDAARIRKSGRLSYRRAARMICRVGRLKHCTSCSLWRYILQGCKIQKKCKAVIRRFTQKWRDYSWNMFLAERLRRKLSA